MPNSAFGIKITYEQLADMPALLNELKQIRYPAQTGYYDAAAEIASRLLALAT